MKLFAAPRARCPDCGTRIAPHHRHCWLCEEVRAARQGRSLAVVEGWQFDLATVLLTVTLIAICLAVGRLEPLVGVVVTLLSGLAYIRTALAVYELRSYRRIGVGLRINWFLDSFVVIVAVLVFGLLSMISATGLCLTFGWGIAITMGLVRTEIPVWCLMTVLSLCGLALFGAMLIRLVRGLWPEPQDWLRSAGGAPVAAARE